MTSWVVWFKDGRYAYAWGETAEEARAAYLWDWNAAIVGVKPASDYHSALPEHRHIKEFSTGLTGFDSQVGVRKDAIESDGSSLAGNQSGQPSRGKQMPEDDLWP